MTWGLPRRRLDQVRQPASGAMAPGSPNNFIGRLVIVFGPAGIVSGVFVYLAGTKPGPGNPPIAWMTSGTKDPYGNALPQSAQMGLAGAGIFAAGNKIITPSGIFSYAGTPGAGGLSQSVVSGAVPVTDPYGNAALPGITTYQQSGGTWYANNILASQMVIWTAPSSAGPYTQSAAGLFFLTGGNTFINAISGQKIELSAPVKADFALEVAGVLTADEQIVLAGIATPAGIAGNAVLYAASASGYPKALGSTDTNVYHLGAAVHDTFVPQTINSAVAAQIDGLSHNVLSGQRYKYEAMVVYHGSQNAGNPIISLAYPGTNAYTSVAAHEEWSVSGSAPSQTNTDLSFIDVQGPALTVGRYCYESRGFFQPSANQVFTLSGLCSVAADPWVVDAAYLRIEPWT